MYGITIYRIADSKEGPAKMSTAKQDAYLSYLAGKVRVHRPNVVLMVIGNRTRRSQFYTFPVLPHAELWNPKLRTAEVRATGLELEVEDLGRKAHKIDWNDRDAVQSLANSVTIWISQHVVAHGLIGKDEFSVLVDEL